MTRRDFLRLPPGEYKMTDGIWNYTLVKSSSQSEYYKVVYRITLDQSFQSVCLFEGKENVYDDSDEYKYTILTACTTIGGISLHSDFSYHQMQDLKIIPKSSYKQWLEKVMEKETPLISVN